MANGYWVIRTYTAGAVGEKIKYWVAGEKPTRSERKLRRDIKQAQRNEANAEKHLARTLNANCTAAWYLVTLSYDEDHLARLGVNLGEEELFEAAEHQLKLWLKRSRRACRAAGIEFRYIATTSDMDGETGAVVRVHHHVVVCGEAAEVVISKWTAGATNREHLYDQVDYTPLAHYLLAQVRHRPNEKKYTPSRNLVIPQPKDRVALSGAELQVPRGGQLLLRSMWMPGMPQYIRYIVPEVGRLRREAAPPEKTK